MIWGEKMVTYNQLLKAVKSYKPRSAWDKGVKKYAVEIIFYASPQPREQIESVRDLEDRLLYGASGWGDYSWGGCSLISDKDIAKRLLTPDQYKGFCTPNGRWASRDPNSNERWHDVQARALYQASNLILNTYEKLK